MYNNRLHCKVSNLSPTSGISWYVFPSSPCFIEHRVVEAPVRAYWGVLIPSVHRVLTTESVFALVSVPQITSSFTC